MNRCDDFDIVQITSSSVDAAGFVGCGGDWLGQGGVPEAQAWSPLGLVSVPMDPTMGVSPDGGVTPAPIAQACNALQFWEGSRCHMVPLTDPRAMAGLPNLSKGDSLLHSTSGYGNFVRTRWDGRIELSTKDANGADFYSILCPIAVGGVGPGFYDVASFGSQSFDGTGWHLKTLWGACVDVGGYNAGGPLAAFSSFYKVRADSFSVASSVIKLGAPSANPATLHTPVAMAVTVAKQFSTLAQQQVSMITAIQGLIGLISTLATGGTLCTPAATAAIMQAGSKALGLEAITTQLTAMLAELEPITALGTPDPAGNFASQSTCAI